MIEVLRVRNLATLAAVLLLTAASLGTTAIFSADRPGADLRPVDGASEVVQILQGNQSVLWTALSGSVGLYRVEGWPVSANGNDLGGALMIERPADGSAGVIDVGEKPRSIVFDVEG
jgi:hypothetical protein